MTQNDIGNAGYTPDAARPERAKRLLRIACPTCKNHPESTAACLTCAGQGTIVSGGKK